MLDRSSTVVAIALVCALTTVVTTTGAQAADDGKYPTNWKGQWTRVVYRNVEVQGAFVQTKPWGRGQEAPLTPEYQKVHEDSMADQANGGLGNYPTARCLPSGMPRMMTFGFHEYVITPETTYILTDLDLMPIWSYIPADTAVRPDRGRFSTRLTVDYATDGSIRSSGNAQIADLVLLRSGQTEPLLTTPLGFDNQSVFKERFFIDKTNPDIIHILTTVIDNALTRPWTSDRQYMRVSEKPVQWPETWCQEGNANVVIGKENYFLRTDGLLMPAKKNQTPPDLRYFQQTQK